MNRNILLLTDYKGFFGSKQKSHVYRGGMDIPILIKLFNNKGYKAETCEIAQLDFAKLLKIRPIVLYTSSEDKNSLYKSYIEDIIYHLEKYSLKVIPNFDCLKAHNNKVAMELLRDRSEYDLIKTINSRVFGTLEELEKFANQLNFPVVIKPYSGAMSKGVSMALNKDQLIRQARKISNSKSVLNDIKDILRLIKYRKMYLKDSTNRNKFIVQNFVQNLNNDWKVLVYSKRCYILYRGNRDNDFRASGSGKFDFRKDIPQGILDYALSIKEYFKVPNISLDVCYDGEKFHLIEFQFIYFGTTTIEKSEFYFENVDGEWIIKEEHSNLEEVYCDSIINYIDE